MDNENPMDKCNPGRFTTLGPLAIDALADEFDSTTLAALQRDVEALAAGNGPTAEAWRTITATLAEAYEKRYHLFERH